MQRSPENPGAHTSGLGPWVSVLVQVDEFVQGFERYRPGEKNALRSTAVIRFKFLRTTRGGGAKYEAEVI